MLRRVVHFFLYQPGPDESIIVRIAMLLSAALSLMAGTVAAVQLHWAALIVLPFGFLILWAYWLTGPRKSASRSDREQRVPRLTAAALERLAMAAAQHKPDGRPVWVRMSVAHRPGVDSQPILSVATETFPDLEYLIELPGIKLAVPHDDWDYFSNCEVDFVEADGQASFLFRKVMPNDA